MNNKEWLIGIYDDILQSLINGTSLVNELQVELNL